MLNPLAHCCRYRARRNSQPQRCSGIFFLRRKSFPYLPTTWRGYDSTRTRRLPKKGCAHIWRIPGPSRCTWLHVIEGGKYQHVRAHRYFEVRRFGGFLHPRASTRTTDFVTYILALFPREETLHSRTLAVQKQRPAIRIKKNQPAATSGTTLQLGARRRRPACSLVRHLFRHMGTTPFGDEQGRQRPLVTGAETPYHCGPIHRPDLRVFMRLTLEEKRKEKSWNKCDR